MADPARKPSMPVVWYYFWGVLQIILAVWGFFLFSFYYQYIKKTDWWKKQCPLSNWNQNIAVVSGSGVVLVSNTQAKATDTGTKDKFAVTPWWTERKCLNASPILQWNIEGWFMMITHGASTLAWTFNIFLGNDGRQVHGTWYFLSKGVSAVAVVETSLALWANQSYGTVSQVFNSWTGYPNTKFTPDTIIKWDTGTNTTNVTDGKYLMWKSTTQP